MLQTVLGLDAARIDGAFRVAPATMSQRLVRAKAKIKAAGIPFVVPQRRELPARLDAVLEANFGAFGSGWDDAADPDRRALADEAVHLARMLHGLMPGDPEVAGLLALTLFETSRGAARRCLPVRAAGPSPGCGTRTLSSRPRRCCDASVAQGGSAGSSAWPRPRPCTPRAARPGAPTTGRSTC